MKPIQTLFHASEEVLGLDCGGMGLIMQVTSEAYIFLKFPESIIGLLYVSAN